MILTALALAILLLAAPAFAAAPLLPVDRWRDLMALTRVPGAAVVVVRDSGIVATATLGERDREHHRPVTPHTRFYVASCTKPFVATAAFALAADGVLDLDAPLHRILPEFRLADPGLTDSLTLRDLLAHRQGLASAPIQFATANTGLMSDSLFDRLLARVQPRRRFRYSNLHYLIAARAIAARTGETWQRILAERVLEPAGLVRATTSARTLYADADVAFPYELRGDALRRAPLKTDRTMHAAGGLGMSLEDLARWLRLQLGSGAIDGRRVFSDSMMRAMREPAVKLDDRHPLRSDQRRTGWAAGWEIRDLGGQRLFIHNGSFRGAAACMAFLPERNLAVGVLLNGGSPQLAEALSAEAFDAALGRESPDVRPALEKMQQRTSVRDSLRVAAPAGVRGRFANVDWGALELVARRGAIDVAWGDLCSPLEFRARDRFTLDDDTPGALERDARGRVGAVWLRMNDADSVRFVRR